jgi:hypothetical protein
MIQILSFIAWVHLVQDNARAYGFEVARQGVVKDQYISSPDNPFVHNWRHIYGLEQ